MSLERAAIGLVVAALIGLLVGAVYRGDAGWIVFLILAVLVCIAALRGGGAGAP